ncbi:hypothetical protein EVAR_81406_1 [Eumeta japonica]|uniref:Uncharacterized protein n=1 Tax=Eumeta variegata TaxID=151549 RepID=A0A4C1WEG6_EUMVA|nr:hypothetical protein EVAR_81406_1 [Eumeta japonica]
MSSTRQLSPHPARRVARLRSVVIIVGSASQLFPQPSSPNVGAISANTTPAAYAPVFDGSSQLFYSGSTDTCFARPDRMLFSARNASCRSGRSRCPSSPGRIIGWIYQKLAHTPRASCSPKLLLRLARRAGEIIVTRILKNWLFRPTSSAKADGAAPADA